MQKNVIVPRRESNPCLPIVLPLDYLSCYTTYLEIQWIPCMLSIYWIMYFIVYLPVQQYLPPIHNLVGYLDSKKGVFLPQMQALFSNRVKQYPLSKYGRLWNAPWVCFFLLFWYTVCYYFFYETGYPVPSLCQQNGLSRIEIRPFFYPLVNQMVGYPIQEVI